MVEEWSLIFQRTNGVRLVVKRADAEPARKILEHCSRSEYDSVINARPVSFENALCLPDPPMKYPAHKDWLRILKQLVEHYQNEVGNSAMVAFLASMGRVT